MVHDHGYDFEYDQMRFDPLRALVSHALLWEKHKRLLLPHSDMRFYLYLVENNRPMFIPHKSGGTPFSRGPGGGQFGVTSIGVTARSGHHAKLARGQPRICWTGFIPVPGIRFSTPALDLQSPSVAAINNRQHQCS